MTLWTAGFLFNQPLTEVLLIQKNKGPEFLIGKWNGIGGHVEANESGPEAMQREFKEEAGLDIANWVRFCELKVPLGIVDFFYAISSEFSNYKSLTNERVSACALEFISNPNSLVVPNVQWLIPMALNHLKNADPCRVFKITEGY